MTDLVAPVWMDPKRGSPVEHCHAMVLSGGLIASVVVASEADGRWAARTQLRDRSFDTHGDPWRGSSFSTCEAALEAGKAAALRLHKAMVGMHEVPEPAHTITFLQPPGGYRSQALRRFARAQSDKATASSRTVVPMQLSEAEMTA